MLIFSPQGELRTTWGEGVFPHPHGVWIGPDGSMLLTDRELHQVFRYTRDGQRRAAWGTAGQAGAPGRPFNEPARAVAADNGEIFVADGYGQHRVHRITADGKLIQSWGQKGTLAGEFGWPVHTVCIDPRGRLLVADRGNNRIQLFTQEGIYLGEWGNLLGVQDIFIGPDNEVLALEGAGPAVCVLSLDGERLARWGERGSQPGQFAASPHSLWMDSHGDLYIGEVTTPNLFQKFVRQ